MKFSEIIGQEAIIRILKNAIHDDRCSNSYLFAGPDGIGKRSTALAFAQVLNCQRLSVDSIDACEECISCRKIKNSNHPDVELITVLEGKKEISIEQVRQLRRKVSYKPLEADRKVYIIDDANALNVAAANCLLKTLEEPPGKVILILITENIYGILPTIRSRCQIFKFKTISKTVIQKILEEGHNQKKDKAQLIAELSQGRLGQAIKHVSSEIEPVIERVEQILKIIQSYDGRPDYKSLFKFSEEIYRDRESITDLLNCLLINFRGKFIQNPTGETKTKVELVLETQNLVSRNINPQLALNEMLIRLSSGL